MRSPELLVVGIDESSSRRGTQELTTLHNPPYKSPIVSPVCLGGDGLVGLVAGTVILRGDDRGLLSLR